MEAAPGDEERPPLDISPAAAAASAETNIGPGGAERSLSGAGAGAGAGVVGAENMREEYARPHGDTADDLAVQVMNGLRGEGLGFNAWRCW